ncbi:MAG: hypothetical protein JW809_08135 [Pirellulales bacterium]|nr:hypothetical protein [Pirellulales bacterium]
MSRILLCALGIGIAGLMTAGRLQAQDQDTESREVVWVGVSVHMPNQETNDYLIGTIEKKVLDEIELGKCDRTFIRLSNLRIENDAEGSEESGLASDQPRYLECEDEHDWGVILIPQKNILSIELKKRDPLEVQ